MAEDATDHLTDQPISAGGKTVGWACVSLTAVARPSIPKCEALAWREDTRRIRTYGADSPGRPNWTLLPRQHEKVRTAMYRDAGRSRGLIDHGDRDVYRLCGAYDVATRRDADGDTLVHARRVLAGDEKHQTNWE